MPPPAESRRIAAAAALVSAGITLLVGARWLDRGWVPHDEGLLGQAAERALAGQWPHVHFLDTYTGGLARWNALSFRALGVSSMSMRLFMLPFFAAFLAAVFALARRAASPAGALGITALAALLSLPNYPATMPSWYNLFLGGAGLWCALGAWEGGRGGARRGWWWFAAGACGGLSILFKITGLYWVAGGGVLLLLRESEWRSGPGEAAGGGRALAVALTVVKVVALLALAALVMAVSFDPGQVSAWAWHYALPAGAWLGCLAWRAAGAPGQVRREGLVGWGREVGAFALGVGLPVAAYALPYAAGGFLDELLRGLFVLPARRLGGGASFPLPEASLALYAAPLVLAWIADRRLTGRPRQAALALTAAGLGGLVWVAAEAAWAQRVFLGLRQVLPLAVIVAAALVARAPGRPRALIAVVTAGLLLSLIQVPFAGPLYFLHFAPLVPLVALHVLRHARPAGWGFWGLFLVAALAFASLRMGWPRLNWYRGDTGVTQMEPMGLPRAALRVPWSDAEVYRDLVDEIHRHALPGEPILATPDCPEVYFLSGTINPTPHLYEMFGEPENTGAGYYQRRIAELGIKVLVFNEFHRFSPRLPPRERAALERAFPHERVIGLTAIAAGSAERAFHPFFTVRWRE